MRLQEAERAMAQWIRRALRSALASSVLAGSGCASSPKPPPEERFRELPPCTRFERSIHRIRPDIPFDYMSIRTLERLHAARRQGGITPVRVKILSEIGSPCRNAPDSTCLERLNAGEYRKPGEHGPWFIGTLAGDVRIYPYTAKREFFGAIDTPTEAAWLVYDAGYELQESCLEQSVQAEPGRFVVRAYRSGGDHIVDYEHLRVTNRFLLEVRTGGEITIASEQQDIEEIHSIEGRRPAGLVPSGERAALTPGGHFAQAAREEAASVAAFSELGAELSRAGAPVELVNGAHRAAHDELRHSSVMAALARGHGETAVPAVVHAGRPRDLFAIALDNAVEGCVNETFSALRIAHQALRARDASTRAALTPIARDEMRHAAWSWQLAGWAEPRLRAPERAVVTRARRAALDRLVAHRAATAASVREAAGFPDLETAARLAAALQRKVRGSFE